MYRKSHDLVMMIGYRSLNVADERAVSEYHGYGKVAAYEDSDPSFLIYRKFGWLHNRILLHLQDELVDLEDELENLDNWEAMTGNPKKLVCRRLDDAAPEKSERRLLLKRCNDKLAEYGRSPPRAAFFEFRTDNEYR